MLSSLNKSIVSWIDETFYPKHESFWDDKMLRQTVLPYVNKETVMLDAGAGRGILPEMNFKGLAKEVHGVDPVEEVKTNPFLDKGYVGLADDMPFFEDNKFDLIVSDNVLEHVDNPDKFFAEISRVMKSGGIFIAKTPNKYHYMPLFATITPLWFHKFYNKLKGRDYEDTFPTRYKANTKKDQTHYGKKYNLEVEKMQFIEGRPEYLRILFPFYFFGIVYEKLVNILGLEQLKIVMITVMKKN